jgi:hypothetical protein
MTRPQLTILASLVFMTALSACGGGGGATSQIQPVTPPPAGGPGSGTGSNGGTGSGGGSGATGGDSTNSSGPASTDIADLIAFADKGTRTEMQFRDNAANGWDRSRNCGGDACVVVDRIAGAEGAGLVIYQAGPDVFVYDVFGSELASMAAPTGIYNGLLTANYRVGADGDWIATVGEMNLWLDMADATVAIGGILPYASANGVQNSSIQFFGDADVVDGKFTDPNMRVLVNAGSPTFFETTATTTGLLVTGDDGSAILGTMETTGDPDLLLLQGGYLSTHDPRF